MKKLFIVLFLLACLTSCSIIEQDVNISNRIHCTYQIETWLWGCDWPWKIGQCVWIEKAIINYDVKKSDIEYIKTKQLDQIQSYKEALDQALKYDCK